MSFGFNPTATTPTASPYNLTNVAQWFQGTNQSQHGSAFNDVGQAYGLYPKSKNFQPIIRNGLSLAMLPGAMESIQFGNDNMATRNHMLQMAAELLNPANNQRRVDQFRKRKLSESKDMARQAQLLLAERGYTNDAAAQLMALNQAHDATNQFATSLEQPDYVAQAASTSAGLYDQGMSNPLLALIMAAAGGGAYTPPVEKPGLLQNLMGLGGMAAGLGWNPFRSGGGSSGNGSGGGRTL